MLSRILDSGHSAVKSCYTGNQILAILRQTGVGASVLQLYRAHGQGGISFISGMKITD
ncbi:hypothetical protein [Microbulbifer spongiae]|uniref:Uncharacterized protein n=1 Tax=Microbulbifer spongiae TaxID=2944933 RepID=A0ABY9E530_9GAMM|nr:hypothetical protein [Microbulbifer sp. MI-G]WKD48135.1 hypothetical protein M8T91_09225 [Microbulbifer sp. MI-G]